MAREFAALFSGLEPVLPELAAIPVHTWLVTHRELHTSRRIRLVYDLLAQAFADKWPGLIRRVKNRIENRRARRNSARRHGHSYSH